MQVSCKSLQISYSGWQTDKTIGSPGSFHHFISKNVYFICQVKAGPLLHHVSVWEKGKDSKWRSDTFFVFIYFNWRQITLQYCGGFCHSLTWISHGCTCILHPEPPFHLPPHPISQGHASALAFHALFHASNLVHETWWSVSHVVIYMFQCCSLKSSPHSHCLPQSPKVCSLHLFYCLFCCLTYRVVVIIFLNSVYAH